ncbi:hypothetical protein KXD40_005802 [Peronospora effusa]|uniref:RNA helicase n=1 Tax=Peronospora effusa TaxID=542832 RepID=A0A3M6VMW6_9STRA|nr:hypothetical protein DD238_000961 [Peronospora effusa]UIZ27680.1 hypothetical protein KXD40_005802 [Peronospora effusa]
METSRFDTTSTVSTTTFNDLPLHRDIGHALEAMRFMRPSPIQLHALPVALFGNDVIGQAKSGTGKTAVFGITAIEHAIRHVEQRRQKRDEILVGDPLALILAPTREIAVQIESVLHQLAQFRPEIIIRTCIGGLSVTQDQLEVILIRAETLCLLVQMHLAAGCHIVVGTPGRVKALVDQGSLSCSAIRLLILDEVDKLMAQDFEKDIRYIADAIPERRQIVRVRGPHEVTTEFISSPEDLANWKTREQSNAPELWLRQVRQFYSVIKPLASSPAGGDTLHMKPKVVKLVAMLSEIVFVQCMVFCNDKFRAEALATALSGQGWPAACITGSQAQATRMEVMEGFREARSRVLVSTDLTARGIDVDKVNFVVNLDLPRDPATYLHRVGRTGRFGGKGLAVTLLSQNEVQGIHLLGRVFKMEISELPTPIPPEIYTYAAVEEVGESNEAPQFVACMVPDLLPDKESDLQVSAYKLEKEVQNATEKEVEVNKSSSRGYIGQYEKEEQVYAHWVKLL